MIKEQPIQQQQKMYEQYTFQKNLLPLLIKGNAHDQFSLNLRKQFDEMNGTNQQKCKILKKRLQKFFGQDKKNNKINVKEGFFCQRRDPFYTLKNNVPIQNQIILYGTDFLSKKKIIQLYKPQQCIFIDYSHWKLIYDDYLSALDALIKNRRHNVIQNQVKLQNGNVQIPKNWMQMKPYYAGAYQRRIVARFAMTEQKNIQKLSKPVFRISEYAKNVFLSRKKESQKILQNCRLRQQRIRSQRMQKRSNRYKNQDQNYYSNKFQENMTIKSNRIPSNNSNKFSYLGFQMQKQRSRSRSKQNIKNNNNLNDDEDDRKSVYSRKSNISYDIINNLQKFGLNEDQSSDLSFILNHDHQLSRELKEKFEKNQDIFNQNNINQKNKEYQFLNKNKEISFSKNLNNSVYIENKQISMDLSLRNDNFQNQNMDDLNINSKLNQSYSLTLNMPGLYSKNNQNLDRSYSVKSYKSSKSNWYQEYLKQQQIQEKIRKQETIPVIDLLDDDD